MRTDRHPRLADHQAVTIAAIGDVHLVPGGEHDIRAEMVARDLHHMIGHTTIDAIVQLGDQTTDASAPEFAKYVAWRATLPAGIPRGEVPGNHDIIGGNASGTPDLVTPSEWADIMGYAQKDNVVDVGRVRILLVSPAEDATTGEAHNRRLTIDPPTVQWIEDRCDEAADAGRQVVICFHAPLYGTVGPLDGSAFSSYDERWHAHWDDGYPLTGMIARHPNVAAWVAGHTHSRFWEEDVVCRRTYGDTTIAHVAVGSPAFWNPGGGRGVDRVVTALVTVRPDRVEVRYRDHGLHQWLTPVHTITL